jgi:hypothetical protein
MFTKLVSLFYKFAPVFAVNMALKFELSKTDKKRLTEINHWIKCAESLAQVIGHVHAKEIVAFLREYTFPASPVTEGFKGIQATPKMQIPITVLLPEDSNVGGIWQKQYDMSDGHMANFVRGSSCSFCIICLKGHIPTSDFAKGILCLHEGKHAWHFFNKPYRTKEEKLSEELEVMEFECRLIELFLGGLYKDFISEEAYRIKVLSKGGKNPIQEKWFDQTFAEFNRRFSQPLCGAMDKSFFITILYHAVIFKLMDEQNPRDARLGKLDFMAHLAS